jgi:hypothetical protein
MLYLNRLVRARVPLITTKCFSSSSAAASKNSKTSFHLFTWYAQKLDTHPFLTKGISSGIIASSADFICQKLSNHNEKWDQPRTGRFFIMGTFFVAPVIHFWFLALHTKILPGASTWQKVVQRVLVDQLLFAPIFLPSFLSGLWLLEGSRSISTIQTQLVEEMPELMVANWALWVPAMTINFGMVPIKFQVLFSNVVALVWNVYLSYKSAETTVSISSETASSQAAGEELANV